MPEVNFFACPDPDAMGLFPDGQGRSIFHERGLAMSNLILMAGVFLVSFVVGYVLICRVPSLLHTPLMSMTNAISAVTLLGALLLFSLPTTRLEKWLGSLAIISATFNVVGGFAITDRMLGLFRQKGPSE
ncbi:NAD(P) transhydrogenase subunit alpha [Desulfosarcina alkanivorans]|nr:NAD(P) transhydrogenase subunit alpha [Desulfosarcina alkanivorans]